MTNGGTCVNIKPLIERFLADDLDPSQERLIRLHADSCEACRQELVAAEPSLLFMELRGRALPESFWTGFQERLAGCIPAPGFDWRFLARHPRLTFVTAPVLMLLVLGVSLFVVRPWSYGPGRGAGESAFRAPRAPAAVPSLPGGTPAERLALGSAGRSDLSVSRTANVPALEEVGSPGARVYRFTVLSGETETPIYLVVDESIDI